MQAVLLFLNYYFMESLKHEPVENETTTARVVYKGKDLGEISVYINIRKLLDESDADRNQDTNKH